MRLNILLLTAMLPPLFLGGQNILGGEITYDCAGQDSFKIKLTLYEDCSDSANLSSAQTLRFYSQPCDSTFYLEMHKVSAADVTPICPNQPSPCQMGAALPVGIEKIVFENIVHMPPSPANCGLWDIYYSFCCRGDSITNLQNPGLQTYFISTQMEKTNVICNSSPESAFIPKVITCDNQKTYYNPGMVDPDGDSLAYHLFHCRQSDSTNVIPATGVGIVTPVVTKDTFKIDPVTGTVSFTPDGVQTGVYCIRVEEYRNGNRIGEIYQDIQIVVMDSAGCWNPAPFISGIDGDKETHIRVCPGQPVDFSIFATESLASQASQLDWNAGIPGATFQNFSSFWDSAHFSWVPGLQHLGFNNFIVRATDDGCPLTATNYKQFTIEVQFPGIKPVNAQKTICAGEQTFIDFTTSVSFDIYQISGPIDSVSGNRIFLSPDSTTTYTITGINSACTATDSFTIVVNEAPEFVLSAQHTEIDSCKGSVQGTATGGTPPYTITWNTGDTTTGISDLCPGLYSVTIVDSNGCQYKDSVEILEVINGVPSNPGSDLIHLYPNPTHDQVICEFRLLEKAECAIQVFDILGRQVMHIRQTAGPGDQRIVIPMKNQAPGTYLVSMRIGQQEYVRKIELL